MKNFYSKIEETLKLSTAKYFRREWDKSITDRMFDGKMRIYLNLPKVELKFKKDEFMRHAEEEIIQWSEYVKNDRQPVEKVDFQSGLLTMRDGRQMRIGRYLNRLKRDVIKLHSSSDARILDYTIQRYNVISADLGRLSRGTDDYLVVISRHPYDIAGMSTDRGWTSCMNIGAEHVPGGKSDDEKGCHADTVKKEIVAGSMIAYLIKKDDTNIKRPVARIMIRPYISGKDKRGKNWLKQMNSAEVYDDEVWELEIHDRVSNEFYEMSQLEILQSKFLKWNGEGVKNRTKELVYQYFLELHDDDDKKKKKAFTDKMFKHYFDVIKDEVSNASDYGELKLYIDDTESWGGEDLYTARLFKLFYNSTIQKNVRTRNEFHERVMSRAKEMAEDDMKNDGLIKETDFNKIYRDKMRNMKIYYKASPEIYGTPPSIIGKPFVDTVTKWLKTKQARKKGTFYASPITYQDRERIRV